jgi:hypothetical protein
MQLADDISPHRPVHHEVVQEHERTAVAAGIAVLDRSRSQFSDRHQAAASAGSWTARYSSSAFAFWVSS